MENNKECPVSCLGKLLCGTIPVFIFFMAAGYLIHHIWLMPIYEQTASLWRPMNQMKDMMPLLLGYYAVLSVAITTLFCKLKKAKMQACGGQMPSDPECKIGGKKCPIKYGACFGFVIGLLMGTLMAGNYIWMPIPQELAVKWFIAGILQGVGAGIVLALVWHCKSKKCA